MSAQTRGPDARIETDPGIADQGRGERPGWGRDRHWPGDATDPPLRRIGCSGCGRWFTASDGPAMLASLRGACPDCGGRYGLIE
jgi:hypothetical protein